VTDAHRSVTTRLTGVGIIMMKKPFKANNSGIPGVVIGLPELKGLVYTYGVPGQAVRYMKTTEAVAEYVGTNFSKELWNLVLNKEEAKFDEPDPPDDKASKAVMKRYEMKLKRAFDKEEQYEQDKSKVFRIIMGQCAVTMKNKVESSSGFSELEKKDDVIGLLKRLKDLAYTTDNVQYDYWTMQAMMRTFIDMKQEQKESLSNFAKRFLAQAEVTEDVWGKLIPNKMKGKPTADQEEARNKFLACIFLAGVDKSRYGGAIDDLNNEFVLRSVRYPGDVPSMMALLSNRRGDRGGNKYVDAMRDGTGDVYTGSFAQYEEEMRMSFAQHKEDKCCYCCGEKDHIATFCPKRKDTPQNEWYIKKVRARRAQFMQQGHEVGDDDTGGVEEEKMTFEEAEEIGWSS